jgi:mono/diheme cytochrome c family protein
MRFRESFLFGVWCLVLGVWCCGVAVPDETPNPKHQTPNSADPASFEKTIRPVLVAHCYGCHSQETEKPKGDLRLDRLAADFGDEASRQRWATVLKRVRAGEMPPKGKPRLAEHEVQLLSGWINARAAAAENARRAAGRVVLRRLNRVEYENTVRDLLGVEIDLKEMLPLDTSAHGFDNIGEALHVSSFLMERYLEAADAALNVAIANGPQPPVIKKRFSCKDERQVKNATESVYRQTDDAVVFFSSSAWNAVTSSQFYPPDRGKYCFRISAYGFRNCSSRDGPTRYRPRPVVSAMARASSTRSATRPGN